MPYLPLNPLDPRRLGPLLAAAGFATRELPGIKGYGGRPPMILHFATPDHLVAVLEWTVPRGNREVLVSELSVYPDASDLHTAYLGPVQRAHARAFGAQFDSAVPAPVIGAAAIAALAITVPRRARR